MKDRSSLALENMAVMPMWSIILVIAGIFIFAILGGLLGKALLKKHFAKAGIV